MKLEHQRIQLRTLMAATLLAIVGMLLPINAGYAQDGPPQYVREAVDGTIDMLASGDADAADAYVDQVMTAVAPDQRAALVAEVASIRAAVGDLPDEVDVDGGQEGATLTLDGERGRQLLQPASNPGDRADQHLQALERLHRMEWADFVTNHLSVQYRSNADPAQLEALREQLVYAAANAGGAGVDVMGDVYRLTLGGPEGRWAISFTVENDAPFGIKTIEIADANANLSLPEITRDNLESVLAMAEDAGLDGVVYVMLDGEELARNALGFSNRELGQPMTTTKLFGVGSQPIDYTVPLAYIAAEQGHLSLDAPISQYVDNVPEDKAGMTVRHLLNNMSGLPDFVDNESDWDPDLAWITREEFVRRILTAPLRFEPGERRGHSHAGFSFLAALVEIATERPYYDYLKEQILDPAGMTETAMYGDALTFATDDFAVGGGASRIGLPNIPPNWGPTSWLVKGSGGMYSSLEDILKFTRFIQSSETLPAEVRAEFSGESVNFNGSMRGFEMFEYRRGTDTQILVFSNSAMGNQTYRDLAQRLEQFASSGQNGQ